ncbi:MAG: hypothetical protein QM669_13160 [Siphonobacter sp.]
MTTTFELHETELDERFLKSIKTLFKNQRLRLVIEASLTEEIASEPISSERLSQATEHVRKGQNVKVLTFDELDELEAKVGF